jgi:TRAP-type C4-dicarboxylate transport system substrate-binding protein
MQGEQSMRWTLALVTGLMALCGAAVAQTRWDLPTAYPTSDFHTLNIAQFGQDVDRETAGRLKITIYANATLFKAPEIKRAVQGGQAPIGEILLANHADEWAVFGADGIPFLADSYDAAWKLYRAQRPLLEHKFAEQGMLLLYAVPWPPQGIYSRKPLASGRDIRGAKWRAYNPPTARIAELMGAQSVTVQSAELPQAMELGMVDVYMSSSVTGLSSRTPEFLKFWADTRAWLPKNAVLVNKRAFDALDRPTQLALLKAGAQAETRGWQMSGAANDEAVVQLRRLGVNVQQPSAQLKADLQKVGQAMLQEWTERAGAEGKALLEAYRKP